MRMQLRGLVLVIFILGLSFTPNILHAQENKTCDTNPTKVDDLYPDYNPPQKASDPKNPALPNGRPFVNMSWQKDYLIITYDAKTGHLFWHDYATGKTGATGNVQITKNSAFAPITYTKEKIIVRVCGARFGGSVTATPSTAAIPEGAPDVRGLAGNPAPAAPAAPAPPAAGHAFAIALQEIAESPTENKSNPTYVAALAAGYDLEYQEIELPLNRFGGGNTIDSVDALKQRADILVKHPIFGAIDKNSNVALFNDIYLQTQALATDVSSFQSSVASANFNSQGLAQLGTDFKALQDTYNSYVQPFDTAITKARKEVDAAKTKLANAKPKDKPAAQREEQLAEQTLDSAQQDKVNALSALTVEFGKYNTNVADVATVIANENPSTVLPKVESLAKKQEDLHRSLSELFSNVNKLHADSDIVITTVVTPVTTNSLITISISVNDGYTPLGFGAPAAVGGNTPGAPQQAQKQGNQGATPSPTMAASTTPNAIVQIEVHRVANFNVVGGILVSLIPNRAFSLESFGSGMSATSFAFRSQNDPVQLAALAGIAWYPGGRDMYPVGGDHPWNGGWHSVSTRTWRQRWTPAVLFGTSVSSLGTVFIGPDFEPVTGLDTFFGLTVGKHTSLSPNIIPCPSTAVATCATAGATPVSGSSAPTRQGISLGFSVGFGFDANIFSLFGLKGGS